MLRLTIVFISSNFYKSFSNTFIKDNSVPGKATNRGKRRRVDKAKDKENGKDKSLFVFHALGKLLYAKRDPSSNPDCLDPVLGR